MNWQAAPDFFKHRGTKAMQKRGLYVLIVTVALAVLVLWAAVAAYRFRHVPKPVVSRPFTTYTRLSYSDRALELYLDPSDQLFGLEHWSTAQQRSNVRPQRRTTVKRSPSGLGVDFGASLLEVRQRFGPPVGVIRHADLLVYGYWHQENGQIVLDKGYKLFEFHNGRLTSITAFFTDFVLPRSVRRGTQRSTVIAKYGPPDRTVRGREPIAEPGFGPVPFPTAVPLAAWIIAGLAAAVLSRLICVTAPIRESRWLRAFALACVGSISFLLGITAIMGAGGRLTMPIMLSIARMAMPIGFVYGLLYGLVFWPRMVADGQSRALWRTAAFLVVGTVCGLILLRLIARGHWTTLTFISLSFGSFGLAWVFWSWLVTVLTASSTREAG